ncbi:MAG TPA: MFS transporter [Chloroflexota bacterium]
MHLKSLGRDPQIARCIAGSFLLRAAASGAVALISFFIADMERSGAHLRGSLIIGVATTLFFAAEIVGAMGFGMLADRHGERHYMRLGPVFGGISALAMALGASLLAVVLARVLQGLSTAAAIPASLAVLSRQSGDDEQRRGRVMSMFEIAAIGGMAAGLVSAGEIWDAIGAKAFYLMIVIYALSLGLLWSVGRARGRESGEPARSHGHGIEFLRSPKALRLVPAWVAVNAVLGVWLTHLLHQLKKADDPQQFLVGGFTGAQISHYGAITLVLFVAGIGVWGYLMGRLGSLRVMAIALAGLVALCPSLFLLNHAPLDKHGVIALWIVASAAALFVASGFTPAALAYLSKIAEEQASQRGTIMGLYSVLLGVGQAIGGSLGSFGAEWRGVDGMIALSVFFVAAAIVAVAALIRADRVLGPAPLGGPVAAATGRLRAP